MNAPLLLTFACFKVNLAMETLDVVPVNLVKLSYAAIIGAARTRLAAVTELRIVKRYECHGSSH